MHDTGTILTVYVSRWLSMINLICNFIVGWCGSEELGVRKCNDSG